MEEQENKQLMFIRAFYNDDNIIKRLEFSHSIATTLDKEVLKKITKQIKQKSILNYIESILKDTKLIRNFNLRYSLSSSAENVLYFGRDYGLNDTYAFLEDVEKKIQEINLNLLKFVNVTLKELNFTEEINLNYK